MAELWTPAIITSPQLMVWHLRVIRLESMNEHIARRRELRKEERL